MSRIGLFVGLIALVYISPASRPGAQPVAAAAGRCANIQIHITPLRGSAGAGHVGVEYRMHNMWGSACTLQGYPGAELLGARFHTLPTHLHRGLGYLVGAQPVRLVTLPGHGNAYFILEWDQIRTQNQPCQIARYFMVIPPNDNMPVVTYAAPNAGFIRACSGNVTVSPVSGHPIRF
ncbi:MAG TPA: DUF4232 domain-containing protein [Chloroflexota bacterium]|nr:DUF4232 domain-containing protein [Chloroflexota bacterium]